MKEINKNVKKYIDKDSNPKQEYNDIMENKSMHWHQNGIRDIDYHF